MSRSRDFVGEQHDIAMSALLADTDWAATPLGPLESWPATLLGYVRMALDMPTPAIIFWGPEQTQIYNAGYATIMGPRHPRYFGAPYRACWPDTYPTIYPWMRRVLEQGEVVQVTNEHIPVTRYGFEEETYFTFTFSPLRDDGGRIAGILQPVFEVTDAVLSQRRAATLQALEPKADAPEGMGPALAAIAGNPKDIPFAVFYLWNAAAGALEPAGAVGAPPASDGAFEDVARSAFELLAPQTIDDVQSRLGGRHVGPWPEPTRAALVIPLGRAGTDGPRGAAVMGLSARLDLDDSYRAFLELVAGQVVARVAAELARAARRREAERQRQYLGDLFIQAPAAIALLQGPDHTFQLSNPLYQQLIGAQREVLGRPMREALPELEGQPFYEVLDDVYRSGEPFVGTEVLTRLDRRGQGISEEVFFDFVFQPMRDGAGNVEGILIFAYDVTAQVRARQRVESLMEEQQQEHRRKDEFLAMLAHELRNPLAAIHNAVRLLEESAAAKEPDVRRPLPVLRRQAAALSSLVDDLLDVSRITRGLVELRRQWLDLAAVVRCAIESVQPQLDERRHRVRVDLAGDPVPVMGDPVRLEQILVNLLTNAAKFTEPGGNIVVSVGTRDEVCEVRVRDSGIGLEADALERIFSLFGQAAPGQDRSQGGLGIGLTIARSLVELHGGTIEARSEGPGEGAEFVVTLPQTPQAEAVPAPAQALPATAAASPQRVLVVDDNVDAAETLALLLEAAGHQVAVAYDGPSAVSEAQARPPQFVLLDLGLPGMDGYQVAEQLRRHPRTRAAKIAALTGYGQPRDRARTDAARFDAHLVKPVELETVLAFLDEPQGAS